MNFKEVQRLGKKMGLKVTGVKKDELIRAIQSAEGNITCFGTERVQYCGEKRCLWYDDCLKYNKTS